MHAHWLDTNQDISADELNDQGIIYSYIKPDETTYLDTLKQWMNDRSYTSYDEVRLSNETPNLEELLAKFIDEHLHTDDEVRYVLSGAGIFDIRSPNDQWMRVKVEAGDFIIVPADVYHRFMLDESREIHAIRLFKDNPSWVPVYR